MDIKSPETSDRCKSKLIEVIIFFKFSYSNLHKTSCELDPLERFYQKHDIFRDYVIKKSNHSFIVAFCIVCTASCLSLIWMAIEKCVTVQLGVIYDSQATIGSREGSL